jgi:hypothetical protein
VSSDSLHYQTEELGQMSARMTLDMKDGKAPKREQVRAHTDVLNDWHRHLPPNMHLNQLNGHKSANFPYHMKRSLLQMHFLFLVQLIEPRRDLLISLAESRLQRPGQHFGNEDDIEDERQCISAAQQGARTVSILQFDNMIRPRCWVCVYVVSRRVSSSFWPSDGTTGTAASRPAECSS